MKKILNKLNNFRSRIFYTILVVLSLSIVFISIIGYIYIDAEKEGYENLHIQIKEIKEDIQLQMKSDQENLYTMAQFASKLYSDGENFDLLLKSFKSIGLIENIGILMPDNTLVTRYGSKDVSDLILFENEVNRGPYISGRVKDLTNPQKEVIRSSVPVFCDGKIVAILYGVIEFNTLENRYIADMSANEAQLYVLESGNGNFLINTVQGKLGNISSLASREYRKGYTFQRFYDEIKAGKSGYSSFVSAFSGENLYIHYSPLNIGDWYIMFAEPEANVFAEAKSIGSSLSLVFIIVVFIMMAYIFLVFSSDRKQANMNYTASVIRRLLLGINQQLKCLNDALKEMTVFSKSKSAFFLDTDGEYYNYVIPSSKEKKLSDEDKKLLLSKLVDYDSKKDAKNEYGVYVVNLSFSETLKNSDAELYELFKLYNIKKVCFAVTIKSNGIRSILGVINPKKRVNILELLKEISVCFSMAIFNKKHLEKTEYIAITDSLTGLSNRVAYKKDIAYFNNKNSENFSCIYIDVNELHIINNKYGHSAGDGMLIFVANTLKEFFDKSRIYRIGGDEFLIFVENVEQPEIENLVIKLNEKVSSMNYHISVGTSFRTRNINTEDVVLEAEKRMYEDKAIFYQRKEQKSISDVLGKNIEHITTGIRELDETLSIMSRHYRGIYCVSLDKDSGRRILMPEYFRQFSEKSDKYSKVFSLYIHDMVKPDYHRALFNFLEYDVLRRQINEGYIPCISYTKNNDENIMLSVYPIRDNENETLWIFEKNK